MHYTFIQNSLEAQNGRLLNYLQTGNKITSIDAEKMGINNLHSRIPELKAVGIPIYSRFIKVGRIDCKEYSLQAFQNLEYRVEKPFHPLA